MYTKQDKTKYNYMQLFTQRVPSTEAALIIKNYNYVAMQFGTVRNCSMCHVAVPVCFVASFPVPRPAFLYRTKQRQKAGRGTGNEAMCFVRSHVTLHSISIL